MKNYCSDIKALTEYPSGKLMLAFRITLYDYDTILKKWCSKDVFFNTIAECKIYCDIHGYEIPYENDIWKIYASEYEDYVDYLGLPLKFIESYRKYMKDMKKGIHYEYVWQM